VEGGERWRSATGGGDDAQRAARVNSVVNGFSKVTAEGSSTDVNIC